MKRLVPVLLLAACGSETGISLLERSDTFTQQPATELDILLVVDNSCSMEPYQNELSRNFDAFLSFFREGDVDYHIGVLTTSVLDVDAGYGCTQNEVDRIPPGGQLVADAVITPNTTDADALFNQIVNVGTCGSANEMGLESAALALDGGVVDGFLRDDAFLSLIFVSDEEDFSPDPVNDYINRFRAIKGPRNTESFNASAIVLTDPDECSQAQLNAGGTLGTRYIDVATQGQGILGNICDDSFERVVTELSLASSRLSDRFYLTEYPDIASIVVNIDGVDVSCAEGDWTYEEVEYDGQDDQPAIVFDRASMPPPFTEIVVRYNRGEGGVFACGATEEG
jgi:hypothetical protein